MSIFSRFQRKLAPKTYASSKRGKALKYFDEERKELKKFRLIYEQGGLVSEGIDSYPLLAISNGYTLQGEDENLIAKVQDTLDKIDIETVAFRAIRDSLLMKFSVHEIVENRGETAIMKVLYRQSEDFTVNKDKFGEILGFEQKINEYDANESIPLKKDDIFYLDLDIWLMRRAYDDIMRHTRVTEAIAALIERHGFSRFHAKVGQEGEVVSQEALSAIGSQLEDLKPSNEFVTCHDVELINIDQMGVQNVSEYSNWSILELATALGVPEEILGLGRGSTEATANVRQKVFYDKIATIQKRTAQAINQQIIDRMTNSPGAVWMVFNDVNPEDELRAAEYVSKVYNIDPISPIVTPDWCRERLGIEIDESELENAEEAVDEPDKEPIKDEQ